MCYVEEKDNVQMYMYTHVEENIYVFKCSIN